MTSPEHDVVRCGPELVRAEDQTWLSPADVSAPLIVFVHGFTAHGRYLAPVARYVGSHGSFQAALFNYDSHRGIDHAAQALGYMLEGLDGALSRHGYALVGHSMGGLVCRYFGEYEQAPVRSSLRGIATLGTPHRGTLSRHMLNPLLDWADDISIPNPFARSLACRASVQLTDASPEGLIGCLNARTRDNVDAPPTLSISGGLPYLQAAPNERGLAGMLRNLVLQKLIADRPNDGLVAESSSDLTVAVAPHDSRAHARDYPAYARTNHTHLVQNQQVAMMVVRWLKRLFEA